MQAGKQVKGSLAFADTGYNFLGVALGFLGSQGGADDTNQRWLLRQGSHKRTWGLRLVLYLLGHDLICV